MGVGGDIILFKIRFQRNDFFVTLQFLSEFNNIFHVKGLTRFTFNVKLIDDRRKAKQEKYYKKNI